MITVIVMAWVKKKTGRKERFTVYKIMRSVIRAGGTVELAGEVADAVVEKVLSLKDKSVIHSSDIKKRVLSKLRAKNKRVAKNFVSFKG